MKVLNKVIPYRMRRIVPMLGMAGATMFGGCSKDNDIKPTENKPLREVAVFTFGHKMPLDKNWDEDIIRITADSANIKEIIFRSDGTDWNKAFNEGELKLFVIDPKIKAVSPENRYKIRGEGEIVGLREEYEPAAQWMREMGYTLVYDTNQR